MDRKQRGQSLVELALLLPVLLAIVILMVEVGFAMRNYLVVVGANREGVRFASRGRFDDETVAQQIVTSGGVLPGDGEPVSFLRTLGDDANTGIIITHLPIRDDGVLTPTVYLSGTLSTVTGARPIAAGDSRIDLAAIAQRNISATLQINQLRESAGYERLDSEMIVLEVFYTHETLWRYDFVPIQGPWPMYTQSSMRVVSDARERE